MSILKVILIWICISADNFSVANASSIKMEKFDRKDALKFSGFCTFFHVIFFLLGWFFAFLLIEWLEPINYWMAFSMFFLIGVGMILNALEKTLSLYKKDLIDEKYLSLISIIISMKSLLLGFGLAIIGTKMFLALILLAVFVFFSVWMGYFLRNTTMLKTSKTVEIIGGIILIIISLSVLVQFSR